MPAKKLVIFGAASKNENTITVQQVDLKLTLLEFLMQHGIPVASSCAGEGVCRKCVYDGNQLSCEISLETLFADRDLVTVAFSYL